MSLPTVLSYELSLDGADEAPQIDPVKKSDGSVDDVATMIKNIHSGLAS
jgi:hypothetical protein